VDWINLAQDTNKFEHGKWNFVLHKWLGLSWLAEELTTLGGRTAVYGDKSPFLHYFISCVGTREPAGFTAARRALEANQIRSDGVSDAPTLRTAITLYKASSDMNGQRYISSYLCV